MRYFYIFVFLTSGFILLSSHLRTKLLSPASVSPEERAAWQGLRLVEIQTPKEASKLGELLFEDEQLTPKGSCKSCHEMNAGPYPLANLSAQSWFFDEGSSKNLSLSILNHLEEDLGGSRLALLKTLTADYLEAYEEAYGECRACKELDINNHKLVELEIPPPSEHMQLWMAYQSDKVAMELDASLDEAVNSVLKNTLFSLETFVKGFVTEKAAFDRFMDRFSINDQVFYALGDGFTSRELKGLKLFSGKAKCIQCHSGPFFSDFQFRRHFLARSERLQLGHFEQLWKLRFRTRTCQSLELDCSFEGEKEFLAHWRTPSLRLLANRKAFVHDSSYESLEEVLSTYTTNRHYQDVLGFNGGLDLELDDAEISQLLDFLRSIQAPIRHD